MKISNVLPGHPDVSGLVKAGTAGAAATVTSAGASAQSSAAMRQILAQYDVTDISPSQFTDMVQKLQQNGAIAPQDAKNLSAIRLDLEQAHVDPDESINLVDFYQQKVQKAQRQFDSDPSAANQQQLAPLQQRLNWMQKLAAGHAHPEDIGLNTTA
jgi:hypothetical protein